MAGLPASGKSTLCRELAARLSGAVLDKDEIRSTLFSSGGVEYSTGQDDFCMCIMLQTGTYILERNPERIIFLDGRPFSRRYQIEQVVQQAEELKQPWRILECVCSDESARRRLENQAESGSHPAADRDYQLYLRVKASFEKIAFPRTIIDTEQPLEFCVQLALATLQ